MKRIALVGCGKEKLDRAAPARQLYTGQLFRASIARAEANFEQVFILSAKHGVLDLDQVAEPYDLSMRELADWERAEWAHVVMAWHLAGRFSVTTHLELEVFAGDAYVEPLRWQLPDFPAWAVRAPLAGLQVGQRLQWLKLQRRAA